MDHSGLIPIADLASSSAYGLFHSLVPQRNVRLTAVKGKIQHEASSGRALVEHEDVIDQNMEFAEAAKAQTMSKSPLTAAYKKLLAAGHGDSQILAAVKSMRSAPKAPANALEQYGHDLIQWESNGGIGIKQRVELAQQSRNQAIANLTAQGPQQEVAKYGKFIFRFDGNILKVASKYGQSNDPNVGAGGYVYSGPLVQPT